MEMMKPTFRLRHLPHNFRALLTDLRRELHRHPELSGLESVTPRLIRAFVSRFSPDRVIDPIGSNGLAVVYDSGAAGPTLLFRAELDALPADSDAGTSGADDGADAAHRCGHDGHMAAVAGLAPLLHANPIGKGRVVLLFQPAEETGRGARQIIDDPRFADIAPDMAFAWHNLPGYPLGQVLVKGGLLSYASVGMQLLLVGRQAHASQPQEGVSPAPVMCELIGRLPAMVDAGGQVPPTAQLTIVHARLGNETFGTAPGSAVVLATLRAETSERLRRLQSEISAYAKKRAAAGKLSIEISWVDEFSESCNSESAAEMAAKAAARSGLAVQWLARPFSWSEDFGRFTARCEGAMLVVGAGQRAAPLHSTAYAFPDVLLEPAAALLWNIIDEVLSG